MQAPWTRDCEYLKSSGVRDREGGRERKRPHLSVCPHPLALSRTTRTHVRFLAHAHTLSRPLTHTRSHALPSTCDCMSYPRACVCARCPDVLAPEFLPRPDDRPFLPLSAQGVRLAGHRRDRPTPTPSSHAAPRALSPPGRWFGLLFVGGWVGVGVRSRVRVCYK